MNLLQWDTDVTDVRIDSANLDRVLDSREVQNEIDRRSERALARQQMLVPVDTGNLKAHLDIRDTNNGRNRLIGAFDVDYGAAVENGSDHVSSRGKRYHIPAQPYIKPSIDALRD